MSGTIKTAGMANRSVQEALSPQEFASVRAQLVRVVTRVCPRWLADQAEDITQTALMRVLNHHRRSGEDRRFSPSYLMKAAHNATVDEIRRRFRRPETAPEGTITMEEFPSLGPHPEAGTAAREIDRGIRSCLAGLAQARRRAVTLYLLGHSLAEAASMLGWTRKRAEHLIYRGLADLRQCLAGKGLTP